MNETANIVRELQNQFTADHKSTGMSENKN